MGPGRQASFSPQSCAGGSRGSKRVSGHFHAGVKGERHFTVCFPSALAAVSAPVLTCVRSAHVWDVSGRPAVAG